MGTPKHALIVHGGGTLGGVVATALRGAGAGRVVTVGAPVAQSAAGTATGHRSHGISVNVPDTRPGEGPLAALEALLASGIDERYLVCPCDLPLADAAILGRLTHSTAALAAFIVERERSPRPLPLWIGASLLPTVRALLDRGTRAIRGLVERPEVERVPLDATAAGSLEDADTPDALARLGASP